MRTDESIFEKDLLPGETILWTGQPDPNAIFSPIDVFLVPFSILWGGFAVFWELAVSGMVFPQKSGHGPPAFFALFGVPFVLMGLYFIFGRFFFKAWKKRRTWYAVTDRRALIVFEGFTRNFQAADLASTSVISKSVHKNGSGMIRFGSVPFMASMYGNTGMEFFGSFYGHDVPAFYDVRGVEDVYRLVSSQKR